MRFICLMIEAQAMTLVKVTYGKISKMGTVNSPRCFLLPYSTNKSLMRIHTINKETKENIHNVVVSHDMHKSWKTEDDVDIEVSIIDIDPVHETELFALTTTPKSSPRVEVDALISKK